MPKPYRLLVRIKNNRLWSAIVAKFPGVKSQSEAARLLGVDQGALGRFLNMKIWPFSQYRQSWWRGAVQIAKSLRETEEYLFDASLYGKAPVQREVVLEVGEEKLIEERLTLLDPPRTPEEEVTDIEMRRVMMKTLTTLTPKEQQVLIWRFGLNESVEMSLGVIAGKLGVTTERIRQIEAKALRKMRHSDRTVKLKEFTE